VIQVVEDLKGRDLLILDVAAPAAAKCLAQRLGREPSLEEVAGSVQSTGERVTQTIQAFQDVVSLEHPVGDGDTLFGLSTGTVAAPFDALPARALESIGSLGLAALRASAEQESEAYLGGLGCIQEGEDGRFVRRALLSIRQGTDRATGAIVASISEQPAYHLDWPRDGAFLSLLLDAVGRTADVERHNRFYRDVQIRSAGDPRRQFGVAALQEPNGGVDGVDVLPGARDEARD
jgi:hypothetical protein